MKIIIKITKQEAIEAWKKQNEHISVGGETSVEIEEGGGLIGSSPKHISPVYPGTYASLGGTVGNC